MTATDRTESTSSEAPTGSLRRAKAKRRKVLLAVAGVLLAAVLLVWFVVIPYPWTLRRENPESTALMAQRMAEARADSAALDLRQDWIPLERIAPELIRAVIVAEDYRFRQHEGVDWVSLAEEVRWTGDNDFSWLSPSDLRALAEAVSYVWSNKEELRGRSTITQQLAKNLYFGTERTFARKGMELVVARRLERRLGKDRILEIYLNTAEWGPGIFGVEAAAQTYFGRSASSLDLREAATLAATLPHPLTSNPDHRPRRMIWRRDMLLERLDPDREHEYAVPPRPEPLPKPELGIAAFATGAEAGTAG